MLQIPTAQRHQRGNSQRHSITSGTSSPQLPTAQRHLTCPATHFHRQSTPRGVSSKTGAWPIPRAERLTHAHATLLFAASHCVSRYAPPYTAPAASACHCVLRNFGSKLTCANQRITCACRDFATPSTSTRARSRILAQGNEIQQFQLPRMIPCACHAKRCPATPRVTPFPTLATRNARYLHDSPRLPRETTTRRPARHFSSPIPMAQRLANARESSWTRREHGPPPKPHLRTRTLRYAFGKKMYI